MAAPRAGLSFRAALLLFALCGAAVRVASASLVDEGDAKAWQDKAGQPIPGAWILTFNDKVASAAEGLARCVGAAARRATAGTAAPPARARVCAARRHRAAAPRGAPGAPARRPGGLVSPGSLPSRRRRRRGGPGCSPAARGAQSGGSPAQGARARSHGHAPARRNRDAHRRAPRRRRRCRPPAPLRSSP
jgi:hypothetical protein